MSVNLAFLEQYLKGYEEIVIVGKLGFPYYTENPNDDFDKVANRINCDVVELIDYRINRQDESNFDEHIKDHHLKVIDRFFSLIHEANNRAVLLKLYADAISLIERTLERIYTKEHESARVWVGSREIKFSNYRKAREIHPYILEDLSYKHYTQLYNELTSLYLLPFLDQLKREYKTAEKSRLNDFKNAIQKPKSKVNLVETFQSGHRSFSIMSTYSKVHKINSLKNFANTLIKNGCVRNRSNIANDIEVLFQDSTPSAPIIWEREVGLLSLLMKELKKSKIIENNDYWNIAAYWFTRPDNRRFTASQLKKTSLVISPVSQQIVEKCIKCFQ